MTEFRACMPPTFQHAATHPSAYMFGLHIFITWAKMRLELSPQSLTLNRLLFTGTTPLSTRMAATMQASLADAETLRVHKSTLVANGHKRIASATARHGDSTETRSTRTGVTDLVA